MINLGNIAIGQYVPGTSLIHRIDPRTKCIIVFLFMLLVFLVNNAWTFALALGMVWLAYLCAKIPLAYVWKGLKPVWLILVITMLLHLWMTREGELLFHWGFITIYDEAVRQAFTITLRIMMIVLVASLLTFTTKPIILTDGLEKLMKPLKKIKFPVHEIALMISIALRFIPTLFQETDKLIKAQASRGAKFTSGNIFKRIIYYIPILIPLFISAFQRADDLALAMESRAYRGGEGRTQLRELSFTKLDMMIGIIFSSWVIAILVLRTWS